ncbi:hypothetical protein R1flu_021530 [Riccia fluitans]|uniref:Ribosomal protein L2 n=1 Tax=Riccia fluitans TaxID=41844 RepID=A0ABD1ZPM7_9MARC
MQGGFNPHLTVKNLSGGRQASWTALTSSQFCSIGLQCRIAGKFHEGRLCPTSVRGCRSKGASGGHSGLEFANGYYQSAVRSRKSTNSPHRNYSSPHSGILSGGISESGRRKGGERESTLGLLITQGKLDALRNSGVRTAQIAGSAGLKYNAEPRGTHCGVGVA